MSRRWREMHTVIHEKRGSTFVILTPEVLGGF